MKSKKFDNISEEDFLRNRERRKSSGEKKTTKRKNKKKSSMHPVLKGFLIAFGILIGIIAVFAIAASIYYFAVISGDGPDNHNQRGDNFINSEGDEINRILGNDGSKKYFTFLATATDVGGSLTDVIMVARFHYDEKEPDVSILQIPRDTYVKLSLNKLYFTKDGTLSHENFSGESATSSVKINEAFFRGKKLAKGKISELLKAVEGKSDTEIESILNKKDYLFIEADEKKIKSYAKASTDSQKAEIKEEILRDFGLTYLQYLIYYNFGIPTDYHAQVNVKGFRGVVDAIDGIDLYVPQDMNYDDPYQDLHIHLKKGQQHLSGKKAEQFVRFRGYPEGDVARLDAQKRFINAFLDKLLSFSTVTKIDDIITEIQSNLYTNVSFNNMLRFADKILNMDLKTDIHMYTLPGTGEYIGNVSYFLGDREKTIQLINEEFNVFNAPLIDEDFKMVDDKTIERPASTVVPDSAENADEGAEKEDAENSGTDENDESDKDKESDENDESDNSDESSEDDKKSTDAENDKEESDIDNKENTNSENKDSKEKDDKSNDKEDKKEDSEKKDTTIEEEHETNGNASSAELDENYQLLLEMAA